MDGKTILQAIGFIVVALVVLLVAWHILGVVMGIAFSLIVPFIFALLIYGLWRLFSRSSKKAVKAVSAYKLGSTTPQVYIFRNEPSVRDLVKLNDEMHMMQLELTGEVFQVPKDSNIILLTEPNETAVKVKIKGANKKDESEGWVCRSHIVSETKQIRG